METTLGITASAERVEGLGDAMTDTSSTTQNDPSVMRTIRRIVATHCCACNLPLTDAESVEHGIGPVCSKRYYNPQHIPTADQISKALGFMAVSNFPDTLIDECLAAADRNDARQVSNKLVYYASANYDNREEVLKCSNIIRILGYEDLSNKLEQDRTSVIVFDKGTHLETYFPDKWEVSKELSRISGTEELMVDGALVEDMLGSAPPTVEKVRAKRGKKIGWKVPMAGRAYLECLIGVFFPNELINYGNSDLRKATPRRRGELYQFFNAQSGTPTPSASGRCSITQQGIKLEVRTPYNRAFVDDLKLFPPRNRRWRGDYWEVDCVHDAAVRALILKHYNEAL